MSVESRDGGTPKGAVFLSYASQDADVARRICEALRAAGVEVWFDQSELRGGDSWDAKIRKQIKECALFVPVISANTEARHEGYFRREWKMAVERSYDMAASRAFLLPAVIDGTVEAGAEVPEEFMRVQWTRLRPASVGGQALNAPSLEAFCSRVTKLLGIQNGSGILPVPKNQGQPGRPAQGPQPAEGADRATTQPGNRPRRARLVWAAAAGIAVLLGVFGWSELRPNSAVVEPTEAAARRSAPPIPEKAPAIKDNSLVVLPLENLSPDPENAFFTDAMHSEIIDTLTRLSDLKVIRRGSALAFKNSTAPLAEIAQKLGVVNVIIGSVQRDKERVKISLELRRASDEAVLWGPQVYDREVKDVFAIHSEISGEVARVLQARERQGTFAGAQFMTKNPRANELFARLQSDYDQASISRGSWLPVIAAAEELVRLDPNFMPGVVRLSTAHSNACRYSRDLAGQLRHAAEAKRWAEAAARLVSGGAGDGALAYYHSIIENDYVRSLVRAENLVRALPNDSQGYIYTAIALSGLGRDGEALGAYDRALALDPLNRITMRNKAALNGRLRRRDGAEAGPVTRFALTGELPQTTDAAEAAGGEDRIDGIWLWRARRFAGLAAQMERSLSDPQGSHLERFEWSCLASDALQRLGRNAAAGEAARAALALAESLQKEAELDSSQKQGRLARALARTGQGDAAMVAGRRYVEAVPASSVRRRSGRETELAELCAYLGRSPECLELLAKLLRLPSGLTVPMLRADPAWDNVRENSKFKALLADPKNSAPL